ncbi:GNAT family N-acetyltransferase [Hamadaea sp. NPDC051192]|uniref:GNAT family N-acetyltransferase n=1 Tax=Hamadaea sp. NPDC051192 TaxID=3154940 RepID=UPI0034348483
MQLEFLTDPTEFLAAAGDHLAANPVVSNVVATLAERTAAQLAAGKEQPELNWWLVVRDESGAVVGAGMRTAPFEPHPPFLLPMPDEAAVALGRALHERGEEIAAINGALPAVQLCATELVRHQSGRVEVGQHTRLHELGDLIPPKRVPGELRRATEDDVDLVQAWYEAFGADADEQAGRPRGTSFHEAPDREGTLQTLVTKNIWFWVDETGEPVHLTGANPPSYGVARVGPVYTPPEQRGRGWASAAVAEVSRRIVAEGARACLFTDQANPTSNKIYAALGYHPVVDMANLVLVR